MTLSLICSQCQAAVDVEATLVVHGGRFTAECELRPEACPVCAEPLELPPIGEWERQWEAEHGGPGWGEEEGL